MKLSSFFEKHPVFTAGELKEYLGSSGSTNPHTRSALLKYYKDQWRIVAVKRELYAVVPLDVSPDSYPVDPYLIASRMKPDAILAYHTALEFHGKAYSIFNRFNYLTKRTSSPVKFQEYEFRGILYPQKLRDRNADLGVEVTERLGLDIKVTTLERTFVDVFDRPDLSGSSEEIWRSLESIEFFNLDEVIRYCRLLNNATTSAKVGYFLEENRDRLMVEESHLNALKKLRPRGPHYYNRNVRKAGQLIRNWNLVVPTEILNRRWDEIR